MASDERSGASEAVRPSWAGPRLTAGAVARRLGVAVTTLRTWDQRYGLGPSEHEAGRHRRYSAEDVRRLEMMRRLTFQGVSPADAARTALAANPGELTEPAPRPGARVPNRRVMPVGLAQAAARGLARAAGSMDSDAIAEEIRTCLRTYGTVLTWSEVLVPVLSALGQRWQAGHSVVEVEHLLSWHISTELRMVVPGPAGPRRARTSDEPVPALAPPRTLLAAVEEEQHTLPLEALAAALREVRRGTRILGARVPAEAMVEAVRRTGPSVVVLWSQVPETADPTVFTRLAGIGRPVRMIAAGPGWLGPVRRRLPAGVALPTSLVEAVEGVLAALGGPAASRDAGRRVSR
ncbi:B12 binding domain-containing protein [Cryptosporangium aurantiacum]|uniref:B12 binding domain-containing protein n=1 Tax=Cryptosporangium aurantiacum TaxID=134849 RepID=A0A1M7RGZ7_9ACTN|nr:MerR family transcriptional regulator [Cryptosporangium aurantiacum]SHN45563.1 B12 binding domain-containing protein [Cryptosporangium aurantiacum]